jgi:cytochrome c-type biogenesis protein CcmE
VNRKFYILIGIALVAAILLIVNGVKNTASLVFVPSQMLTSATSSSNLSRIRLAGRVSTQPIDYKTEPNIELRFTVDDPPGYSTGSIPVVYHGLKPDMFQSGRDVIIDGAFKDGVLVASSLLTQCPSKYEPPSPSDLNRPTKSISNVTQGTK